MRHNCRRLAAALVAALFSLSMPAANATLIDSFALPNPGEVRLLPGGIPGASTALIKHQGAGMLGQERDVLVEVLGEPAMLSAGVLVGYDPGFCLAALQVARWLRRP